MRTTAKQLREGEPSVDEMRYDIAEQQAMNLNISDIIDILIYGCEALDEAPDIEVRDEWEQVFGEPNNES
jgi:hypothetical protein